MRSRVWCLMFRDVKARTWNLTSDQGGCLWHRTRFHAVERKDTIETKEYVMTKNLESMSEVIRNPKYSFRKTFDQAKKQLRHRHERRKIREILHMSDLLEEEMV